MADMHFDYGRRLKNALLCLALSDPRWIVWVENNINPDDMSLQEITRLTESRARAVVLRHYNYLIVGSISGLIFRDDWHFSDTGHLLPG